MAGELDDAEGQAQPRSGKADKATVALRVEAVLRLLIAGAQYHEIRQYATKQGWDVSERQVRRYIASANDQLAGLGEARRERLLDRHLVQRGNLYARAVQAGDLGTALRVLQDEAELLGMYPPKKVAPTTPDGDKPYQPVTFTDGQRAEALRRLLQRVAGGSAN